MKLLKRIITFALATTLCFTMVNTNYARATQVSSTSEEAYLTSMTNQFPNMSNDELNEFISGVYENYSTNSSLESRVGVASTIELQLAWLAAAEIASNLGYPCAATLIKNSVLNTNYTETSGSFSAKIKTTSAYNNWTKNLSALSMKITKSDNADLFYALHNVEISVVGSSSSGARILVYDIFDFAFDNNYNDLFSTAVNNWGWLCQQISVLNPISVTIYFYA